MINFDDVRKEIIKRHNADMSQILDHPRECLQLKALDLEKQIHYLI